MLHNERTNEQTNEPRFKLHKTTSNHVYPKPSQDRHQYQYPTDRVDSKQSIKTTSLQVLYAVSRWVLLKFIISADSDYHDIYDI